MSTGMGEEEEEKDEKEKDGVKEMAINVIFFPPFSRNA